VFYVKFNTTSYVRKYDGTTRIYRLTDRRTDRRMDGQINLGGAGYVTYFPPDILFFSGRYVPYMPGVKNHDRIVVPRVLSM